MIKKAKRKIEVLYVEDNPSDVRLVMEAKKESKVEYKLKIVFDGIEAMDYLRKNGKYNEVQRPDLILLDLNIPCKDGCEVLSEIKSDSVLQDIPVVIFTTSDSEQDIMKCYNLHANYYITKPFNIKEFIETIHLIEDYWLSSVLLPTNINFDERSNKKSSAD